MALTVEDVDATVTDQAVAEFWERGYWISPRLFDADQISRLRTAVTRMRAGQYDRAIPSQYGAQPLPLDSPKVSQNCNSFWLNDEIRAAVTSPVIGKIAARLMRTPGVRLWHDQAIYKPGIGAEGISTEGNIGWHQDYGFWRASSTDNMCTAWVALQDTDLTNGGMRTIVGSHKWGLVEGSDTFHITDLGALKERFQGAGEWRDEPCILRAGQASFHHALTFHGSGPNRTDSARLSVVAHLMPSGTSYRPGQQWHPNLVFLGPDARAGQMFEGNYWPQLWPVG
jgi:ectoine hydroxylase-related dioxygenase (phytanoyl-CoA dioxygenase family)